MTSEVSQGLALGSTLLTLYIDDLEEGRFRKWITFADDKEVKGQSKQGKRVTKF